MQYQFFLYSVMFSTFGAKALKERISDSEYSAKCNKIAYDTSDPLHS